MYIPPDANTTPADLYDAILNNNFGLDLGPPFDFRGINYQLGEDDTNLLNVDFWDYAIGGLTVEPGQDAFVAPSNTENRLALYKIPGATLAPNAGVDGPPNDTDDLEDLDNAISNISRSLSIVNGFKSRFEEQFNFLDEKKIALQGSLSHYKDTDFALETSAFTKAQIKQQTATSMLSQANGQSQLALSLLP